MRRGGWRKNPEGRSCAKGLRQKIPLREEVVKSFAAGPQGTAEGLGSIEGGVQDRFHIKDLLSILQVIGSH